MSEYVYRPLGMSAAEEAEYESLAEGIPEWLSSTLDLWLRSQLRDTSTLQQVERDLRVGLDWRYGDGRAVESLISMALTDGDFGIRLIDHQLHQLNQYSGERAVPALSVALEQGGSAWRVVVKNPADGSEVMIFGLERRVDETVTESARRAMAQGKAGDHLHEAWHAAFSVNPNPSYAYSHAIKAVEIAATGKIGVDRDLATLGTRLGDFLSNEAQYRVALHGEGSSEPGSTNKWDTPGVRIARLMMQLLWTSQDDRHGDPDPAKPISVSQEEAEAAVHLAVLLMQWLESGALSHC